LSVMAVVIILCGLHENAAIACSYGCLEEN